MSTRETWQESRSEVMATLTEVHGVGRARARAGVDEATALGSARVTWHDQGQTRTWLVTFDRYRLTYRVQPPPF